MLAGFLSLLLQGHVKDPNVTDNQKHTALHLAASSKDLSLDVIRLLVRLSWTGVAIINVLAERSFVAHGIIVQIMSLQKYFFPFTRVQQSFFVSSNMRLESQGCSTALHIGLRIFPKRDIGLAEHCT